MYIGQLMKAYLGLAIPLLIDCKSYQEVGHFPMKIVKAAMKLHVIRSVLAEINVI